MWALERDLVVPSSRDTAWSRRLPVQEVRGATGSRGGTGVEADEGGEYRLELSTGPSHDNEARDEASWPRAVRFIR